MPFICFVNHFIANILLKISPDVRLYAAVCLSALPNRGWNVAWEAQPIRRKGTPIRLPAPAIAAGARAIFTLYIISEI
jgi:hypothetical protein